MQDLPVEEQGGGGIVPEFLGFAGFEVGVEDEAARIPGFQQDGAGGRAAGGGGGEDHRVGVVWFGGLGLGEPGGEFRVRIVVQNLSLPNITGT